MLNSFSTLWVCKFHCVSIVRAKNSDGASSMQPILLVDFASQTHPKIRHLDKFTGELEASLP
jgi:hypothetical protein